VRNLLSDEKVRNLITKGHDLEMKTSSNDVGSEDTKYIAKDIQIDVCDGGRICHDNVAKQAKEAISEIDRYICHQVLIQDQYLLFVLYGSWKCAHPSSSIFHVLILKYFMFGVTLRKISSFYKNLHVQYDL